MHAHLFPIRWLPLATALLVVAVPARADIYSVGADGCSHATIQQAIDAAEANPGEDFIRIPHSQIWNEQAIVIDTAQTLWFEGYWSDCNTLDDSVHTTLDGAGGSAAPVIRIEAATGSVIGFDFLDIRNGDVSGDSGKGGGIWYRGNGTLSIKNGSIFNNTAGLGGGLYLEGTGTTAAVTIGANVGITGNVARDSGGGVFAEAVHFYMLEPNSIIAFNEAVGIEVLGVTVGGYGGGLVVNPKSGLDAYAEIGGAGVGGAGVIYANSARYGGGIAVLGETGIGDDAFLDLYSTDPARPVAVRDNFASIAGGGLHLQPRENGGVYFSFAYADLWNAYLDGNAAPDGAAVYLGSTTGGFNDTRGGELSFNRFMPAGAAPCPTGIACGAIRFNQAQDANGQPTDGAVIAMKEDSKFYVTDGFNTFASGKPGLVIHSNQGGRLFDLEGGEDRVHLFLRNVLIQDNSLGHELIRAQDEPEVAIVDSTIAGNVIGAGHVLAVSDDLIVKRSIIWQPGKISQVGPTPDVELTLASEAESLGGGPGAVAVASPRFLDPARGDYRLRAASPAIDYAPPVDGDDRDLLNLPRDQDIPVVPGVVSNVRDIGAFERPSLLPLILNGDFVGDTNLWFLLPGHTGNYGAANAPGSPAGSGSAQVTGTNGDGRLLGYVQCIHLPGPGTYALNGSVLTSANPQLSNPTALLWELRLDGGEGCIDGAITAGGEHALGTSLTDGQWMRPANPALISVSVSEWNHNTSLTVIMVEYPNASNSDYNAYFDAITLEWTADGSDVIFADGFEEP